MLAAFREHNARIKFEQLPRKLQHPCHRMLFRRMQNPGKSSSTYSLVIATVAIAYCCFALVGVVLFCYSLEGRGVGWQEQFVKHRAQRAGSTSNMLFSRAENQDEMQICFFVHAARTLNFAAVGIGWMRNPYCKFTVQFIFVRIFGRPSIHLSTEGEKGVIAYCCFSKKTGYYTCCSSFVFVHCRKVVSPIILSSSRSIAVAIGQNQKPVLDEFPLFCALIVLAGCKSSLGECWRYIRESLYFTTELNGVAATIDRQRQLATSISSSRSGA